MSESLGDLWCQHIRPEIETDSLAVLHFLMPFIKTAAQSGIADAQADILAVLPVYSETTGTVGQKLDAAWAALSPRLEQQGISIGEAEGIQMIQAVVNSGGPAPAVTEAPTMEPAPTDTPEPTPTPSAL